MCLLATTLRAQHHRSILLWWMKPRTSELRRCVFLPAWLAGRPNGLFFAGDLGQRIFQQPFSWKAAGADVRGRSSTLKINYRTSHQIRSQADRLLDPQIADVDGNVESRKDAVSLFNGPKPDIKTYASPQKESEGVANWLRQLVCGWTSASRNRAVRALGGPDRPGDDGCGAGRDQVSRSGRACRRSHRDSCP